jgi:hypothetical protein
LLSVFFFLFKNKQKLSHNKIVELQPPLLNKEKTHPTTQQLLCCNQLSKSKKNHRPNTIELLQPALQTNKNHPTTILLLQSAIQTNKSHSHNTISLLQPELQNKQKPPHNRIILLQPELQNKQKPPHNRIILLQPELQNERKTTSEQNYFAATSSADLCRTPKLETIVQADETIKQQQGYEK